MNNSAANREKYAYREGWLSIVGNTILFALKYWAGVTSGSVAIIADAWHTLSDSVSSIIVLFGAKISAKPSDEEHPFGHGRAELIATLFIGVFLAIVAFEFLLQSIDKYNNHEVANFGNIAIGVMIASVLIKELLAQYAFWAAKLTGSNALKADGWHHRSDSIASVIILVGMFFGKRYWWIDSALGVIVAIIIFYTAYEIMKEAINPLIGEHPDEETQHKLTTIANRIAGIDTKLHHIHIHRYGNHTEITFHIVLPDDLSFQEVHDIAQSIEKAVRDELGFEATIHMEPDQSPVTNHQ